MRGTPGENLSPTDYGWALENNVAVPVWFGGPAIPGTLFIVQPIMSESNLDNFDSGTYLNLVNEFSDEVWSNDSDSDSEEMV